MHVNIAVSMRHPALFCVMSVANGFAMDVVIHQDRILSIILFVLNIRRSLYIGDLLSIIYVISIFKYYVYEISILRLITINYEFSNYGYL